MGRKQEYRNAAEKQKAYRERKKAIETMSNMLDMRCDALRKTIELHQKRGEIALVRFPKRWTIEPHTGIYVNNSFRTVVNSLVVEHMINTGELVQHSEDIFSRFYRLD